MDTRGSRLDLICTLRLSLEFIIRIKAGAVATLHAWKIIISYLETFRGSHFRLDQPEMTRTEGVRAPDPVDIEMSSISNGVATPIQDDAPRSPDSADDTHLAGPTVEQVQTIWNPYKNRFRVLSSCSTVFGNGCNDSAPGALLASIEK